MHLREGPHPNPSCPVLSPVLSHQRAPRGRSSACREEQLLAIPVKSQAHWRLYTAPGGGRGHAIVTSQNRGQDNENECHLKKGAFLSSKCHRGRVLWEDGAAILAVASEEFMPKEPFIDSLKDLSQLPIVSVPFLFPLEVSTQSYLLNEQINDQMNT